MIFLPFGLGRSSALFSTIIPGLVVGFPLAFPRLRTVLMANVAIFGNRSKGGNTLALLDLIVLIVQFQERRQFPPDLRRNRQKSQLPNAPSPLKGIYRVTGPAHDLLDLDTWGKVVCEDVTLIQGVVPLRYMPAAFKVPLIFVSCWRLATGEPGCWFLFRFAYFVVAFFVLQEVMEIGREEYEAVLIVGGMAQPAQIDAVKDFVLAIINITVQLHSLEERDMLQVLLVISRFRRRSDPDRAPFA